MVINMILEVDYKNSLVLRLNCFDPRSTRQQFVPCQFPLANKITFISIIQYHQLNCHRICMHYSSQGNFVLVIVN